LLETQAALEVAVLEVDLEAAREVDLEEVVQEVGVAEI
jgi:hypothetical protein